MARHCLIANHDSVQLFGECFSSRCPPIGFLKQFLLLHDLPVDTPGKYVHLDLVVSWAIVVKLWTFFEEAGYSVEVTGDTSSNQNGPGEHPHQMICDSLHTKIGGVSLSVKFWPYAFHHFLHLYNVTIHQGKEASPFQLCSGKKPNLCYLQVFGCHIYALLSCTSCPNKLDNASCVGIFLSYSKTLKNVLYYDTKT